MRWWLLSAAMAVLVGFGWITYRCWPRRIELRDPAAMTPTVEITATSLALRLPGRFLVADVDSFDDELFAYLMFTYLRGIVEREGCRAWLTYERRGATIAYVVRVQPANDLLAGLPYLFRLQAAKLINHVSYHSVVGAVIARYDSETRILDTAYHLPVRQTLENLSRSDLVAYLRRFIRFKTITDARIRKGIEPALQPLSNTAARSLAVDIVSVADFYSLPLDFFLGIGAIENNYLNLKGDLRHAVWKRRAQRGDVVLRHGPRGVLVLNESSGIWQITRETLRYAHNLFLTAITPLCPSACGRPRS